VCRPRQADGAAAGRGAHLQVPVDYLAAVQVLEALQQLARVVAHLAGRKREKGLRGTPWAAPALVQGLK
jgi:hypothetical protein